MVKQEIPINTGYPFLDAIIFTLFAIIFFGEIFRMVVLKGNTNCGKGSTNGLRQVFTRPGPKIR
jgi:hypothetical protein